MSYSSQRRTAGIAIWLPVSMVLPFLGGLAATIVQHCYFQTLNQRDPSLYSNGNRSAEAILAMPKLQSILSNGLALTAKTLYTLCILSSLPHIIWRNARTRQMSLAQFDQIFDLPSLRALLWLWFSRLAPRLLPLLLVATSIWSLSAITLLVPSSIVIANGESFSILINVPTVNLSAPPGVDVQVFDDPAFTQPSSILSPDFVRTISVASPPTFPAPDGCKFGCNYTFQYDAPALQCTDLTSDQIGDLTADDPGNLPAQLRNWRKSLDTGFNGEQEIDQPFAYNGTTNLPCLDGCFANLTDPYTFTVALKPFSSDAFGSTCVFHMATYEASTTFRDIGQYTNVSIVSIKEPLTDPWASDNVSCPWYRPSDVATNDATYSPCLTVGLNARAMSLAFTNIMTGTLAWFTGEDQTDAVNTPLFVVDNNNSSITVTSQLGNGLSTGLQMLMAHATLSSIYRAPATHTVTAQVQFSATMWRYDPVHLFAVYGVLTVVTAACAAYGLLCLYADRSPGVFKFSHMLAATRSEELSVLALNDEMQVLTPEEKRMVLRFGKVQTGDGQWIHSFGVVGKDKIVSLQADRSGLRQRYEVIELEDTSEDRLLTKNVL